MEEELRVSKKTPKEKIQEEILAHLEQPKRIVFAFGWKRQDFSVLDVFKRNLILPSVIDASPFLKTKHKLNPMHSSSLHLWT